MDFETKVRQGWLPEKPSLSLPKGGGAIRGLGEKFQVNSATGAGSLSLPIELPAARALTPSLTLQYNSSKGNSSFGLGWDINISSIQRRTEKAIPKYTDEDLFLLSGSEELIPISEKKESGFTVIRYQPRVESAFARIERWQGVDLLNVYWKVTTQDNVTSIYGKDPFKRIVDPKDPTKIFQWLLDETYDDKGNHILYTYKSENRDGIDISKAAENCREASSNRYLKQISYGSKMGGGYLFHVVFDYGEHGVTTTEEHLWACRQDAYSSYRSGFEIRTYRLCQRILIFHQITTQVPVLVNSVELSYRLSPSLTLLEKVTLKGYAADGSFLSFPSILLSYSEETFDDRVQIVETEWRENLPIGIDSATYQWVDLYQEGLSGILIKHENTCYYKRNYTQGKFGPLEPVPTYPSFQVAQKQIMALAGEARPCLVQYDTTTPGYFPLENGSWGPFIPFAQNPAFNWDDPYLKQVDLTGDGFPDLIFSKEESWSWHPSLGVEGFGPEIKIPKATEDNKGPILVFSHEGQAIYFADMSGDGLADLVWIENGSISYWPNLGYGYFGSKVTMDQAPTFDHFDQFDPKRLRLGDLNGNGTTDILYIGKNEVAYWLNQAGNSWSSKQSITTLPPLDQLSSVTILDLLGTGTACLVWSSSLEGAHPLTLKYVDLLRSTKPYLLTKIDNQIGAVSTIIYRPSTFFYIEDYLIEQPWKTKLPFPMHLVSQMMVEDQASGQVFTTHYTYHEGFYDLQEREFRGFGFVEQIDDEPHYRPIQKKTWIHLGTEALLTRDYYQLDEQTAPLSSPSLSTSWTPIEQREGLRSLKGKVLREEIFTPDEDHPYLITEHTYRLECLHPKEKRPYPVFLVQEYETREVYYEKTGSDPRIVYEANLETDIWGNPLKTIHIAYKKRTLSKYEEQNKNQTTATFYTYTSPLDTVEAFLGPLIAETKTFEVFNPKGKIPSLENLLATTEQPYDAVLTTDFQIRLIENIRYRYADPTGLLDLGKVGIPVLPGQTFQMAFPQTLLQSTMGNRVTTADLEKAGYIYNTTDRAWWIPSEQVECDFAHFYLPIRFRDPFGNVYLVAYDTYFLKVVSLEDPLKNKIRAEYDYHLLQPIRTFDFNDNSAEASYNALGLLIATAVKGKNGEGDLLDTFLVTEDPLNASPEALLGSATTRVCYNFHQIPVYTYVLSREKHLHQLQPEESTRVTKSIVYSDGFGRVIQTCSSAPHDQWIASGRTVYNRRGLPIQKYEPYERSSPQFSLQDAGVSSRLYYDSKDRLIATHFSNLSYEKTRFETWKQTKWDANNTLLFYQDPAGDPDIAPFFSLESNWYTDKSRNGTDEEKEAAEQAKIHHDIPTETYLDTLGRSFLVLKGDRKLYSKLDIEGNVLEMVDSFDRIVSKSTYDMTGHALHVQKMDFGENWSLLDVTGKAFKTWDIEGHLFETVYDALHRPLQLLIDGTVDESMVYGESLPIDTAKTKNLLGKLVDHHDPSGLESTLECDFKGNILKSKKKIGEETFSFETTYDAMNRLVSYKRPDQSLTLQTYDEAGHLYGVKYQKGNEEQIVVEAIFYNPKGQRLSILYGNQTITNYTYEESTYRLILLETKKDRTVHQHQTYTYDPVGNITHIYDHAQPVIIRGGQEIKPILNYIYDIYYQLSQAFGREHITALQPTEEEGPLLPIGAQNNLQDLRHYQETYTYDLEGNLQNMEHHALGFGWKRAYNYFPQSNRLQSTSVPGINADVLVLYDYDLQGNMIKMPHLKALKWNAKNQLIEIEHQNRNQKASYVYDSTGSRVKKIVIWDTGIQEETLYIGDYEIFRRIQAGAIVFERKTLHFTDGKKRIALFEVSTNEMRWRFQLTNLHNSSRIELDEKGVEISYEEYYPFGSTAIRTGLSKRYRYNGKEKDEESGLSYYGARYCATWLGRWISPDPSGFVDGPNLYVYVKNNPVTLGDPKGRQAEAEQETTEDKIISGLAIGAGIVGGVFFGAVALGILGSGALAIGFSGAIGGAASILIEEALDPRKKVSWGNVGLGALAGGLFAGGGAAIMKSRVFNRAVARVFNSEAVFAARTWMYSSKNIAAQGIRQGGRLIQNYVTRPLQAAENAGKRLANKFGANRPLTPNPKVRDPNPATSTAKDKRTYGQISGETESGQLIDKKAHSQTKEGRLSEAQLNEEGIRPKALSGQTNTRVNDVDVQLSAQTVRSAREAGDPVRQVILGVDRRICPSCERGLWNLRAKGIDIDWNRVFPFLSGPTAGSGARSLFGRPQSADELGTEDPNRTMPGIMLLQIPISH